MDIDPNLRAAMVKIDAIIKEHDLAGSVHLTSTKHIEHHHTITSSWLAFQQPHDDHVNLNGVHKVSQLDKRVEMLETTHLFIQTMQKQLEHAVAFYADLQQYLVKEIGITDFYNAAKKFSEMKPGDNDKPN